MNLPLKLLQVGQELTLRLDLGLEPQGSLDHQTYNSRKHFIKTFSVFYNPREKVNPRS